MMSFFGFGKAKADEKPTSTVDVKNNGHMVKQVKTKGEFEKALKDGKDANMVVVVDFTASWCPPCKMIAPEYQKLAGENPQIIFLKVDVDENNETAKAEGIQAMPTFNFYKNSKKVDTLRGANLNGLKDLVKKHSGAAASDVKPVEKPKTSGTAAYVDDKTTFDSTLHDASFKKKLVVVDFTATWCPPCKRIAPEFEKMAGEYPEVVFVKVDVDKNAEVASLEGIQAMPTFKFYMNKKEVDMMSGANLSGLQELVKKHAANSEVDGESTASSEK